MLFGIKVQQPLRERQLDGFPAGFRLGSVPSISVAIPRFLRGEDTVIPVGQLAIRLMSRNVKTDRIRWKAAVAKGMSFFVASNNVAARVTPSSTPCDAPCTDVLFGTKFCISSSPSCKGNWRTEGRGGLHLRSSWAIRRFHKHRRFAGSTCIMRRHDRSRFGACSFHKEKRRYYSCMSVFGAVSGCNAHTSRFLFHTFDCRQVYEEVDLSFDDKRGRRRGVGTLGS